jgi:iron complex outermembrane receptor protein
VKPTSDSQSALQELVVTGSRIRIANTEISPEVTVITGADIENRGFKNAFDALNNLPQNTGFTQGADYGNTFTPAANTISLRGLGPNHTLILINGQRVADYPVAYNGAVNFVNLSNIPSVAIDRIEVLNGSASAIYGSDAIAGVVNIILKDHTDGFDVNLKGGTTEHGGGSNGRFQAIGSENFDGLSTVFAVEVSRVEPIWADDRGFMSSTSLQGAPPFPTWQRQDLTTGNNITPPNNCAGFASGFQNSTALYSGGGQTYCGSGKVLPDYWTTQTGNQGENLYGSLKYDLNPSMHLFGDTLLSWNHIWNNTRGPSWISDQATTGYFLNQNTGDYESWSRSFAPEEIGGASQFDQYWNDFSGIVNLGVGGDVGATGWQYTAVYNASVYTSHNVQPLLLASVDSYFLGPQLGVDSSGVPIYAPNTARFNQPLTPSQFGGLVANADSTNNSWLQTASLNANGKLFELPAGAVAAAGDLEWGTQGFTNHPDPRINQGVFFDTGGDLPDSGTRRRYAAALELNIPILSRLSAKVATRFDDYSFSDRKEGKETYNASLDYRPVDQVRLHASYGTSFRAPDMNYIFQSKSLGYFASTTDYYRCAITKQPLATCPYTNYSPGANYTQLGSANLDFENGRSFDYGAVFTPIKQVQLSIDYWNLRINDEVSLIDPDILLRTESACLLGQLNINSPQCVQAVSLVQRNSPKAVYQPNAITNITIYPINAAFERTDGIDVGGRIMWDMPRIGSFNWNTTYTRVMVHYYQQSPQDPVMDLVRSFDNPNGTPDFPNKLTSTLAWSLQNWSSTLEVDRFGAIINEALTGYLTPTTLVNLSAQYKFGNATVGVIVNNLFDKIKYDNSYGWPFYAVGYFSPYGRQGWVEFNYHFGGSG